MLNLSFTNPQGDNFQSAVFVVGEAYFTSQSNKSFALNTADGYNKATTEASDSGNNELRYRVFYWPTQQAFDDGLDPYILNSAFDPELNPDPATQSVKDTRSTDEKLWHRPVNLGEAFTSLPAEEMAEKHLREVVLA